MPELVILVENLAHLAQAIGRTTTGDWNWKAGAVDDPGAWERCLVANDLDIVLTQPGVAKPFAIGAVEGTRRRIDLRRARQE